MQQQYGQPQEPNYDFIMYMMAESARKNPKKQKQVYAMVGSIMSGCVAILWFITLSIPWNYIRSENIINGCNVNLFSVYFTKGTVGWLTHGISSAIAGDANVVSQTMDQLFEHHTWISDAKEVFCSGGLPSWLCEEWSKLWIGSWVLMVFGYMGCAFIAIGGYSMYYYVNVHATEVGRKTTTTFLTLGPLCGLIGMTSYIFLTLNFGKTGNAAFMLGSDNSSWGMGLLVGVWLHVMSWIPMYIMAVFSKRSAMEKVRGENPDEFMDLYGSGAGGLSYTAGYDQQPQSGYGYDQQGYGQANYGAAGPSSGYGQPTSSYGQQPYSGAYGAQPPSMGAAFPGQGQPQNAPGMGMAAW